MEYRAPRIRHEDLVPVPLRRDLEGNNQKSRVPRFVTVGLSPAAPKPKLSNYSRNKPLPIPPGLGHRITSIPKVSIHQQQQNNHYQHQPTKISTISRSIRSANAAALLDPSNLYHQVMEPSHDSLCANCHKVIQMPEKPPPEISMPLKADGSWNFNHQIHHPIQRNNSIGGFTLTGQDTRQLRKSRMSKFCSSHKIALVVSTFSFLVTIGLTITLILMKNKGMMEPM